VRGEEGADLLDLLHPRGRELVARAAASGPWTLVLDECHHLLETWGALCRALVRALGDDTWVVGLTATPRTSLTERQAQLHDELFGDCDFLVPTPAVVQEGELAPFQELAYLTAPTVEEDTWIVAERTRFAGLQLELLTLRTGSLPFVTGCTPGCTSAGGPAPRRTPPRTVARGSPGSSWSGSSRRWPGRGCGSPTAAWSSCRPAPGCARSTRSAPTRRTGRCCSRRTPASTCWPRRSGRTSGC
jgi:hypothetical protein